MTKNVRIENADNNREKTLIIEVWERSNTTFPDVLIESTELVNPTDMINRFVYDTRYIIIKEKKDFTS